MKNWCTIKTNGEYQILLYKDEDEDDNAVIRVKKHYEDYLVEMSIGYPKDFEKRDEDFDLISGHSFEAVNATFFGHLDKMKLVDE